MTTGSGKTSAESRRKAIMALYEELPPSVEDPHVQTIFCAGDKSKIFTFQALLKLKSIVIFFSSCNRITFSSDLKELFPQGVSSKSRKTSERPEKKPVQQEKSGKQKQAIVNARQCGGNDPTFAN